jgi:hypothetical protein
MVLEQLPSVPMLLSMAAFKSASFSPGDKLPALTSEVLSVIIDPDHVQHYRQVCAFEDAPCLPETYLQMLAFPLLLKLMVHDNFPVKVMGLVHVRNKITVHKPMDLKQNFHMLASVGESRLVSAGLEWDIDTKVTVDRELVWSSTSVFLHRYKTDLPRQRVLFASHRGTPEYWPVNADVGRRYSRVSGDYNPIHLSDITAKMFGFKRAIAHGMWTKARCVAALKESLPSLPYCIDVEFQRPLFLPSGVMFFQHVESDVKYFSVFNQQSGHAHLRGQIRGYLDGD